MSVCVGENVARQMGYYSPMSGYWSGSPLDPEANPLKKYIEAIDARFDDDDPEFPAITGDDNLRLIGLAGKARSGKDTVGAILKKEFGHVVTLSFAQAIKDGMKAMFGFTEEHVNGALKETVHPVYGKSPRYMMQTLGTDWGRQMIKDSIWIDTLKRRIEDAHERYQHVVITDVRFENEAKLIRELGGKIWHVRRGDAPTVNAHASEAGIAFNVDDFIVYNEGTMEELRDNVVDLF